MSNIAKDVTGESCHNCGHRDGDTCRHMITNSHDYAFVVPVGKPHWCPGWTQGTDKKPDPIHEPDHYQSRDGSDIECIDAMRAMSTPEEFRGYLRCSALKYQWRYREKNGAEDLAKATRYLEMLKEHEERNR